MRIVDLGPSRAGGFGALGSRGASYLPVLRSPQSADGTPNYAIDVMFLEPGGVLGRHPAGQAQLFLVVTGNGWVSGADGVPVWIRAGQAAYWEPGESHESGSAEGMTVVVIQADASQVGTVIGELGAADTGPSYHP